MHRVPTLLFALHYARLKCWHGAELKLRNPSRFALGQGEGALSLRRVRAAI
jgi:hypothetical protein